MPYGFVEVHGSEGSGDDVICFLEAFDSFLSEVGLVYLNGFEFCVSNGNDDSIDFLVTVDVDCGSCFESGEISDSVF